jgi:hypothetical protein
VCKNHGYNVIALAKT